MKKDITITLIITIIITGIVMLYGLSFLSIIPSQIGGWSLFFILLVAGTMAGIIYAVIHNMRERIQEIKEEDKDDLSQY